ncbi:MAG TPA: site-specific integrase [Candidatus Xenobia bacterium]|jgi:integrase
MARKDGKDRGLILLCNKHRLLMPEKGSCPEGCKDGAWWVVWFDQDGKKHREKVGASKTLAREVYQKRKAAVKEGKHFPAVVRQKRRVTVKEVLQAYLEATTRNKTHKNDLWFATVINEAFGNRPIETLKLDDLVRWQNQRADGRSTVSANRPLQLLRRACRRAVETGLIEADPTAKVKLLKEAAGRDRHLLPDEERRFRPAIGPRWWPIVELAYQTGLREDEEFTLEWTQVDLLGRRIKLADAKGEHLGQGVTTKAQYVHLNTRSVEILESLPSRGQSRWVFPNQSNTGPIQTHNFLSRVFRPALKEAGISDFHFHDLRHTYGSRLAMAGVPIYEIMRLMRHKSMRMTERYAHLAEAHLGQAVERIPSYEPLPTDTSN